MERKSCKVRRLVSEERYKEALAIAKDFRIGISNMQRQQMTRAYESIVHPRFYRSIGTDVDRAIREGIDVLKSIYGGGENDFLL